MSDETRSLTRLLSLLCLASCWGYAATWSGNLVDTRCFQNMEDNHNLDESSAVRDLNLELRVCTPKLNTHFFTIVLPDGTSARLDSAGNARAAELVRQTKPKAPLYVNVKGEMTNKTIAVNTVTPAP